MIDPSAPDQEAGCDRLSVQTNDGASVRCNAPTCRPDRTCRPGQTDMPTFPDMQSFPSLAILPDCVPPVPNGYFGLTKKGIGRDHSGLSTQSSPSQTPQVLVINGKKTGMLGYSFTLS